MSLPINISYFKVVVLSIDVFESNIIDERNFSDLVSANEFIDLLPDNLISVLVEI